MNVQAFVANSQSRVWFAHRTLYLPSTERNFRKSVMDPRPIVPDGLLPKCSRPAGRVPDILGVLGNQEGTRPRLGRESEAAYRGLGGWKVQCRAASPEADTSVGNQEVRLPGCKHLGWWQCHSSSFSKYTATQLCVF